MCMYFQLPDVVGLYFLHMLFIDTQQGHLTLGGIVQIFIDNQNIISKMSKYSKIFNVNKLLSCSLILYPVYTQK